MKTTLSLTLLLLLICAPAQAQDKPGIDDRNIEFGDILVCDTQEQVERYVTLYKGDQWAALLHDFSLCDGVYAVRSIAKEPGEAHDRSNRRAPHRDEYLASR